MTTPETPKTPGTTYPTRHPKISIRYVGQGSRARVYGGRTYRKRTEEWEVLVLEHVVERGLSTRTTALRVARAYEPLVPLREP